MRAAELNTPVGFSGIDFAKPACWDRGAGAPPQRLDCRSPIDYERLHTITNTAARTPNASRPGKWEQFTPACGYFPVERWSRRLFCLDCPDRTAAKSLRLRADNGGMYVWRVAVA